jgi:molecular chaperone GrpE
MTEENKNPSEEAVEEADTTTAEEEDVTLQASDAEGDKEKTTSDTQETAEEETPAEEVKERKFFGKKKEKKDKKDEMIEELTDKVKRQMAEFDNFRKRTEKEKAGMYIIGAKDIVEKMLPVVDNFERGLATAEGSEDPFVQGMEKIYKQLLTTLEEVGVKPIEAVGAEFNPDFHNAVMHVEDEEAGENIIVEEFQKGYLYKDFVVRHSMVKVAN